MKPIKEDGNELENQLKYVMINLVFLSEKNK